MSLQPTAPVSPSFLQGARKAVLAFLAPLATTLAGLFLQQGHLSLNDLWVALASAVLTGGGVYAVRNKTAQSGVVVSYRALAAEPSLPRPVTAAVDTPQSVSQVLTPKQNGE